MLISLSIILVIAIVTIILLIVLLKEDNANAEPTIDEIIESSYQTPEITTDLSDGHFVRIQFQIVTDSKDAKEEIEKREFQVRNTIIKALATMNEEAFSTGLSEVEETLKNELNKVMSEGVIKEVYTIDKILQ